MSRVIRGLEEPWDDRRLVAAQHGGRPVFGNVLLLNATVPGGQLAAPRSLLRFQPSESTHEVCRVHLRTCGSGPGIEIIGRGRLLPVLQPADLGSLPPQPGSNALPQAASLAWQACNTLAGSSMSSTPRRLVSGGLWQCLQRHPRAQSGDGKPPRHPAAARSMAPKPLRCGGERPSSSTPLRTTCSPGRSGPSTARSDAGLQHPAVGRAHGRADRTHPRR